MMQYQMIDLNTPIETIESFEIPTEWWKKGSIDWKLKVDLGVIENLKSDLIRSYNAKEGDAKVVDYETMVGIFNKRMDFIFKGLK